MAPKFKFRPRGVVVDDCPAGFVTSVTERILAAVAAALLVALLLAAELRLTPEQRMDLFEASSTSS